MNEQRMPAPMLAVPKWLWIALAAVTVLFVVVIAAAELTSDCPSGEYNRGMCLHY